MSKAHKDVGKLSKPGKRFTANRRLSSLEQKFLTKHNRHVGDVIHAYNAAHASIFLLFWRLAANKNYEMAISLWHTSRSDRGQREMLEAVVSNTAAIGKIYRNGILWAIGALNDLSSFRNDAAHTDMMWYYDQIIPGLATKPQSRKRLEALPFEQHWRQLRGDLIALSVYLGMIDMSLNFDSRWPIVKRPRLQLARSTPEAKQQQRHKAKQVARQRQRNVQAESNPGRSQP